jgi:preprotein translocase subunit SecG
MGLFTFLLVVQTLVATVLIVIILMQRSEGGGLAGGGSPAGMMSARGASDFLTRGTAILATIFVALSIVLAALAASARGTREIDPTLARPATPVAPAQPIPGQAVPGQAPIGAIPGAAVPARPAPAPAAPGNQSGVPLAQ